MRWKTALNQTNKEFIKTFTASFMRCCMMSIDIKRSQYEIDWQQFVTMEVNLFVEKKKPLLTASLKTKLNLLLVDWIDFLEIIAWEQTVLKFISIYESEKMLKIMKVSLLQVRQTTVNP